MAPDVGLSAPYNSWFTLFGQFFDHGLDLVNKGGTNGDAGIVFVPLDQSDPLFGQGPNFMVLTRASHVGPEATNQTTPFVDQSQTYTSHPSHQVFLRDYDPSAAGPVQTGRLITGPGDGMGTWADVKTQALEVLGIELHRHGRLQHPGGRHRPLRALHPRSGDRLPPARHSGRSCDAGCERERPHLRDPGRPDHHGRHASKTGHAFLDDIAHNAVPRTSGGLPLTPTTTPIVDPVIIDGVPQPRPAGTYDDELLDAHFIAGDGRVNENIGLTAVHHIFHSEHNRLVGVINGMLQDPLLFTVDRAGRVDRGLGSRAGWSYEERLFQAARFVTEMEYQHLAFEEFIRKVQPMVNLFGEAGVGYHTDINPAIRAEFAHAVYRFGHSMLTESVDRTDPLGGTNNVPLLDAFLNPPEFFDGAAAGPRTRRSATSCVA